MLARLTTPGVAKLDEKDQSGSRERGATNEEEVGEPAPYYMVGRYNPTTGPASYVSVRFTTLSEQTDGPTTIQ